ncbi:AAA family ATPase [Prosthecobacter sp.]|uniref:AAA family ATPase n=1 Tax=Prosthecobacter sp. TaxID=1965333 RepID=UPI0024872A8A|nr:AAA family ATPase [Prosthecobacter sp.]MDI1313514.1 AAA family ATPase [Prosthecobacter sp.]
MSTSIPKDIDDAVNAGLITSADQLRSGIKPFPIPESSSQAVPPASGPPPLDLAACLVTAAELESQSLPPRQRLLDRWLCEADLGYIFAPRGVGKTWLGMALPSAISKGKALGKWEGHGQAMRVLYVDGEMPLELTQTRSRGLKLGEGDVTYLHHEMVFERLESSLNIGLQPHREAITKLLLKQNFSCIVLDNLSSLAAGIAENKGEDYEPIATWLLELRRRKITVIVIHHAGRNGLMRGHSKREDACSWIIELRDAKNDDEPGARFISHFAKCSRNTADSMPDLLWHFTTSEQGEVGIHCEMAEVNAYETFIRHVFEGVEIQAEIAELMNKPKGTISKWATKAVNEGRIVRSGYKLSPPTPSVRLMGRDIVDA